MSVKPLPPALQSTLNELNKKFGAGTVAQLGAFGYAPVPRLGTGLFSLDMTTGGGWPKGRIVELFGREQSGKTYLLLQAIAQMQAEGGVAALIDVEHSFDPVWAAKIGVDPVSLILSQPDSGEQAIDIAEALVRSHAVGIVGIDSVAAMGSNAELDASMEDQQMGVNARMMNKGLRKLTSALNSKKDGKVNETVVIFINQIRNKIGVLYGSPETTPGGMGLPFFASIRCKVKSSGAWDEKFGSTSRRVGVQATITTVKNKVFAPYRECEVMFMVDDFTTATGVQHKAGQPCHVFNLVKFLNANGLVERRGAWLYMNGKGYQGEGKFTDALQADLVLQGELMALARAAYLKKGDADEAGTGGADGGEGLADPAGDIVDGRSPGSDAGDGGGDDGRARDGSDVHPEL